MEYDRAEMRKQLFTNTLVIFVVTLFLIAGLEFATRLIFESDTILNINIGGMKKYHPICSTKHLDIKSIVYSRLAPKVLSIA